MAEYNDNRSLTTAPHEATTGYVVDAVVPLAVRTPVSEINLKPRIRSQRYDDDRFDSDDYYLNLQSRLDAPQTSWQLDAARSWTSTLTSEFQDVGLVDISKRRNGRSLYPGVTHNLTERTSLRLGGGYEDVSYEDAQSSGLVDTTYRTVDTTFTYMVTERTSLNLSGYYGKLEAAQIGNETRNTGGQLGLDYRYSEQSRLTLSYGYRDTTYEITNSLYGVSDSSNGRIYNVGWQRQNETGKLALNVSQSVLPSGFGYLVERNEVRAAYDQRWGDRTSSQFALQAFQHRGVSVATTTDDRDYARADVGLRWRMSDFWTLSATYVYVWQQFLSAAEAARSNALFLGFNYGGQPYSWSR